MLNNNQNGDGFEEVIATSICEKSDNYVPANLVENILFAINRKRRTYDLWRVAISTFIFAISMFGLVSVWQMEKTVILQSETAGLFSLIFSDTMVVLKFWQDYFYSVVESVPIASVAIISTFIWLTGMSMWLIIKFSRRIYQKGIKHI